MLRPRTVAYTYIGAGLQLLVVSSIWAWTPSYFNRHYGLAPDVAGEACPLFVGRLIRGVTNGPSPEWMQDRLRAIGLRPISALVDITNYVTHDRARPLHVFDAAKLHGPVTVRLARPGEKLTGPV